MSPQQVADFLMLGTCEYIILHVKKELSMQMELKWLIY